MESDLADLGKVWVSWGGVWGGAFHDPIHFEYPGWPHKEMEKSFFDDPPSWYVTAANVAAGFIPGPLGLVQAISPTPTFVGGKSKCPWYDPFGFITDCAQ